MRILEGPEGVDVTSSEGKARVGGQGTVICREIRIVHPLLHDLMPAANGERLPSCARRALPPDQLLRLVCSRWARRTLRQAASSVVRWKV